MAEGRYDTPKKKAAFDVRDIGNFVYDMSRCIKCRGCYWVEHTYMPGVKYTTRCPSGTWKEFDSYQAAGKMRIGLAVAEGKFNWNEKLLEVIYADPLCGACDVGCKRNLDLEIELSLEALRVKAVEDGAGPMPAHRKMAKSIADVHNRFGNPHENRTKWIDKNITIAEKAGVLYFVGCSASYTNGEIAKATGKILNAAGTSFMVMKDEWCCGNMLYSVGMIDEAMDIAKRNIEAVKTSGAKTLLVSCAECYRTWKVDYPKMLDISTADLGFEVMHLLEFASDAIKSGRLKPTRNVDLRVTYHDACSVSRLCDAWRPWKGERGWMGTIEPRYKRRRGTEGLYGQPRDILNAIPGLTLVEMPRVRENAFCCSAGRGTREAFPDLARFAANERLGEVSGVGAEALVSACPFCKNNFHQTAKANGQELKVMDIAEVVSASL